MDAPPTKELRRGLLLIAKVIQNLANNVLFGTKEPYMFPLNRFLVVNISVVTGFLRTISVSNEQSFCLLYADPRPQQVPPTSLDIVVTKETTDFGSCVSFHRFLYDHWDHLRQTLIARERREYLRLQDSSPRSHSPVFEPLRNLITNLGPPPLAISWNRPQIALNGPPLYSRFQNFMLRNAFRSTESFLTSRTIFDGGVTQVSRSHGAFLIVTDSDLGRPVNNTHNPPLQRDGGYRSRGAAALLPEGEPSFADAYVISD